MIHILQARIHKRWWWWFLGWYWCCCFFYEYFAHFDAVAWGWGKIYFYFYSTSKVLKLIKVKWIMPRKILDNVTCTRIQNRTKGNFIILYIRLCMFIPTINVSEKIMMFIEFFKQKILQQQIFTCVAIFIFILLFLRRILWLKINLLGIFMKKK